MPHHEMLIDSIRIGTKLTNQRVLILKQKEAERYLSIYIDPRYAEVLSKILQGQQPFQFISDEVLNKLDKLIDMADSISLVIDGFDKGVFQAKLIIDRSGKSFDIKCPIGKGLLLCVKAGGPILAEESVLEEAGIVTRA